MMQKEESHGTLMGQLGAKNSKKSAQTTTLHSPQHGSFVDIFCFQSLQILRRMCLLNRYMEKSVSWVRIPSPPPSAVVTT